MLRFCDNDELNEKFWNESRLLWNEYLDKVYEVEGKLDVSVTTYHQNADDFIHVCYRPDIQREPLVSKKKKRSFKLLRAIFTDPTKLTKNGDIDNSQIEPEPFYVSKADVDEVTYWDADMTKTLGEALEEFGIYGMPDIISHFFPNHDPKQIRPHLFKIISAKPDGSDKVQKYKKWCKKRGIKPSNNYFEIESHKKSSHVDEMQSDLTKWKVERLQKSWLHFHADDVERFDEYENVDQFAIEKFKKKRVKKNGKSRARKSGKSRSYSVKKSRESYVEEFNFTDPETDEEEMWVPEVEVKKKRGKAFATPKVEEDIMDLDNTLSEVKEVFPPKQSTDDKMDVDVFSSEGRQEIIQNVSTIDEKMDDDKMDLD